MKKVIESKAGFKKALSRELNFYRRNMVDVFVSVSILLCSMVAVTWIFSAGTLTDLPIAVVDNDGSSQSRTYTRMLEATPEMHIIEKLASPREARELLEQASIYAYVLIPKDFGQAIKTGKQTSVTAWYSGQFLTMSGVILKSLRQVTGTLSAGINIISLEKRGESKMAAQVSFNPIQTELRTLFNPFQNYQYFLIAGLLPAMLQVFIMIWTVFVVGREFRDQTSAEWISAGRTVLISVLAKVLPLFLLASLVGMGCLFWLYGAAGWPIKGSFYLLVFGWELMIGAYIVLGLLFVAFAPLLATALSFAVFFTAPAFAYAGVTFPQQAMPLVANLWTYLLPIRSLLRLQVEQAEIGAPAVHSMPEVLILSAFIILPLPFAINRIRNRCHALDDNQ